MDNLLTVVTTIQFQMQTALHNNISTYQYEAPSNDIHTLKTNLYIQPFSCQKDIVKEVMWSSHTF